MTDIKQTKIDKVKSFLDKNNIFYDEKPNGQLLIGTVSLYATTETWYDSNTKEKGKGVTSCLTYLKKNDLA